jgi:hypothetical protein
MKAFILGFLVIGAISCKTPVKKEIPQMAGAYSMLSQAIKGGNTDTTYYILKQLKIFTEDHVMYANLNPTNSIAAFGIGSYVADTGSILEKIIFSAADSADYATPITFKLLIEKTPKGFIQVIPEMTTQGQKIRLTEEYEYAGTDVKYLLDGAWKEMRFIIVKGNDSTEQVRNLFKTFYAGHFMYGLFGKDSTQTPHTTIAFGTYSMEGTNKLKEIITASNDPSVILQDLPPIDNEMNGPDESKQTITGKDGTKYISVFQRLK